MWISPLYLLAMFLLPVEIHESPKIGTVQESHEKKTFPSPATVANPNSSGGILWPRHGTVSSIPSVGWNTRSRSAHETLSGAPAAFAGG